MTTDNKFSGSVQSGAAAKFLIPIGIVMIVFGIIMLSINTDNFIETTGRVISVTECPYEEGEVQQYDIEIRYTVDGKDYEAVLANQSGDYKNGDEIKLFYDPANPANTTNTKSKVLPLIMTGAGALVLVFGVYKTVTDLKKKKELDKTNGAA